MAINVGDAVLVFRGDTTDLDAAFNKIADEAGRKLGAVNQSADSLATSFKQSGQAATTAGALVSGAGEEMERAGARASEAFHATRNSIDLLSGEIGVTLPRELKNFVSEMPAVQSALSGAFSATAVVALGVFVAEAADKISKFVADTFIFTSAMRLNDEAFKRLNGEIATQVENLKQLHDAYELVGLEGSAKLSAQILQLNSDLEKDNAAVRQNRDTILTLQQAYDKLASSKSAALLNAVPGSSLVASGFKQELDQAQAALQLAHDTQTKLEDDQKAHLQQRAILEKQGNVAISEEDRSAAEVRINSAASLAQAENQVWLAQAQLRVASTTGSYAELSRLQSEFEQRQLAAEVSHSEKLRGNLDPSKSGYAAAVQAFNNQIAVLEDENYAAREQAATEFQQRINAILKGATGPDAGILKEIAPNPDLIANSTDAITGMVKQIDLLNEIVSPTANAVDRINEAFRALGITTNSLGLAEQALEQARAIDILSKAAADGTVSFHDIAEAEIEYLRQQQRAIQASDLDAASKKRQTAAYQAQVDIIQRKLDPALKANSQLAQSVANATGQAILSEAYAYGQGATTITQAVRATSAAIIEEVARQAEIKGADALAWGLWDLWHNPAAAPSDFAAAAGWFALAGGISAAAGATAGSGNSGSGQESTPGNLPPTQQTAATTAQPEPIQTVNVQRFATGGITTHRMLAMIGDTIGGDGDSAEAIIPLGSAQAKKMFADTFLPGLAEALRPQVNSGPADRFSLGGLVSRQTLALAGQSSGPAALTDRHLDDIAVRVAARIQPGDVTNHYDNSNHLHAPNLKGVIDVKGVMRAQTRAAKRGQGRLTSSDALRVTRRG